MNPKLKTASIHIGLFLLTFFTTTLAGAQLAGTADTGELTWKVFVSGMPYSITFLLILSVHEFGHYFTATHNGIRTSLPYYIPLPPGFLIGTMGAVIRIKDVIRSRREHFDVGIAGPLAGFVVALIVITYGFTHLPPPEYIFSIHKDYAKYGLDYAQYVYTPEFTKGGFDLRIGENLIFMFFEKFVADPARLPNAHEMMHYPFLFAGFFALVFTSLNLIPIGQLDGGHVLYGLIGFDGHRKVASWLFMILLFCTGLGFVNGTNMDLWHWKIPAAIGFYFICLTNKQEKRITTLLKAVAIFTLQFLLLIPFPHVQGYIGLAIFVLLIGRVVGIQHPRAVIEEPLSTGRKILGWIALLIFVLCFTPNILEA